MESSEFQNRLIGDYIISPKKIGSGSFSSVYIGRDRRDGTEVAVKEIDKTKLGLKVKESLLKEITILRQVSHPNIVRLHQAIQTEEKIYLVLEYCTGGDLAAYIGRCGRVSEGVARHFMRQLGEGLKVLRENNLIHRDLKPQNLFLCANDEAPVLKIGDFGFARYLMPQGLADTLCGSPLYMAPEIILKKKYDAKADLWSVGAILYQLVTGKPPFDGNSQDQLFHNVLASEELKFPQDIMQRLHPDCINLCRGLLRQNPVERLTFSEFFNHKFMAFPRLTECPLELTQKTREISLGYPFSESSNSDAQSMKSEAMPMAAGLSRESTSKLADSFESIEREYVLVHAHFASMESFSSSLGMSLKENTRDKSLSCTNENIDLTTASFVQNEEQTRTAICGTVNKGGQMHVPSLVSKTSTQLDMFGESSPPDPSFRLKLLCKYVYALMELAQEKHKSGLPMESFSIELVALAVWKKALQICNSWKSASTISDQLNSSPVTESSRQNLEYLHLNFSETLDFKNPSSVCSWLEQGFILSYDRAEKISRTLHEIDGLFLLEYIFMFSICEAIFYLKSTIMPGNLEMPDAMDMIFRSALYAGKCGGVDELIGQKSRAVASYLKAIILFSFILNEASSLPLNPPFPLSRVDQQRIQKYIISLNAHLDSSQI